MSSKRRRSPGALENEILTVLFTAKAELSAGQVRERLGAVDTLSYSAVVTTLARLQAKGLVRRRRSGRAYLYCAPADAASLVAWRMNRLLDEQADHRPALKHFIAALSPGDEMLVRQLLTDDALTDNALTDDAPTDDAPADDALAGDRITDAESESAGPDQHGRSS